MPNFKITVLNLTAQPIPPRSSLAKVKVVATQDNQAKVLTVINYNANQPKAPFLRDRLEQFRYFARVNGTWLVDQAKGPYEFVWEGLGSGDTETWPPYR